MQETPEYGNSTKMYVIDDFIFILKRVINHREEYYYCAIGENNSGSTTIRGVLKDGGLIFSQNGFHYEIKIDQLDGLECRILG